MSIRSYIAAKLAEANTVTATVGGETMKVRRLSVGESQGLFNGLDAPTRTADVIRVCCLDETGAPLFTDRQQVYSLPNSLYLELRNAVDEVHRFQNLIFI